MIDPAFYDRFHAYVPGWEIPKMRPEFFTNQYGLIVDYLVEWLREMRKRNFGDAIKWYFKLGRDLNQRDTIAVKHTVSCLLKLLWPLPTRNTGRHRATAARRPNTAPQQANQRMATTRKGSRPSRRSGSPMPARDMNLAYHGISPRPRRPVSAAIAWRQFSPTRRLFSRAPSSRGAWKSSRGLQIILARIGGCRRPMLLRRRGAAARST
jgi:hypothetical protein